MKLLIAVIALVSFGVLVPKSYADDLTLNLGAVGLGNVDLGPVAAGTGVVTYDYANLSVLQNGNLLGFLNLNFTGVWAATAADLPVGATWPTNAVDALAVTESCAFVAIGTNTQTPCSGLAFAYTNANIGNIVGVTGDVNIAADIGVDTPIGAEAGLGVNGGTETIGFGNPPSATPEPGTLSLMGTGLLGVAGVIRRKFRMA